MAMIECKECGKPVSDTATKCPNCAVRLKKPKRGFFGKIAKWSLILFNILMIFWLISYFNSIGDLMDGASDAEQAGAAIGGTIGTGMIIFIWLIGDIILGLWALLTRAKD